MSTEQRDLWHFFPFLPLTPKTGGAGAEHVEK